MTVSLKRHRIRMAFDQANHNAPPNILTQQAPIIWRGTSCQVEVGLFIDGTIVDSITNVAQLILEIHTSIRSGHPLVQKILNNGDLTAVTIDNWNNKTAQHAKFFLNRLDTQLDISSGTDQKATYWMVLHAVSNDAEAEYYTVGGSPFQVEEDGAQNDLNVVPMADPSFRVKGEDIQIWNPTQSKFQGFHPEGLPGQEHLVWHLGED